MFSTRLATCVSSRGRPRHAYPDRPSAEDGARHAHSRYDSRMVPYHCDRCGSWHLCPAHRHTPSRECHPCAKQAYLSEDSAMRRAAILAHERGTRLRVYQCPCGEGWHLTSKF
jgi:hypothetical protein